MPVTARSRQRYVKSSFAVEIAGIDAIYFQSCGPLQESLAKVEYWESGSREPILLAGRHTMDDLVLVRAIAAEDFSLYDWFRQVYDSSTKRGLDDFSEYKRNGEIRLLRPSGDAARRWEVNGMFPIVYNHAELDATVDEAVMESLTLAVESVRIIPGSS